MSLYTPVSFAIGFNEQILSFRPNTNMTLSDISTETSVRLRNIWNWTCIVNLEFFEVIFFFYKNYIYNK